MLVKKVLIVLLAFVYLGVSSGIAMNVHYCMGKIASVELFQQSDKCGNCGMKKSDGCCKDEFKIVKLSDTHKIVSNNITLLAPLAILNNTFSDFKSDFLFTQRSISINNNSPPTPSGSCLCILNCVFRI